MKVVVVGGTGLIGKKLVALLRDRGHEVIAASPSTGVNALTGEGVREALAGAEVVVDVANSPSFEDAAVMHFFETSSRTLLDAEKYAGVSHHVALSVVGTDQLQASGYFRAKLKQEQLIESSGIPYSIVRATQFFEFIEGIADFGTLEDTVRLPPVFMQPMLSDDVAAILADVAESEPLDEVINIAGPDRIRMDALISELLKSKNDPRQVVVDPEATYFGTPLGENTLTPLGDARLGDTQFADWLNRGV
jgi:uncharacterized protein YbjT (DUF2867 family)